MPLLVKSASPPPPPVERDALRPGREKPPTVDGSTVSTVTVVDVDDVIRPVVNNAADDALPLEIVT